MIGTLDTFSCGTFLNETGVMKRARIRREAGKWAEFHIEDAVQTEVHCGYVVPTLPVEFHCHGMGGSDFSEFEFLDLNDVNEHAKREGLLCVLCMFLPHQKLQAFIQFMQHYTIEKQSGRLTHLAGIALEGPLLSSFGGTPEQGMWVPTKTEWKMLAEASRPGLQYIVLSPDALLSTSRLATDITRDSPSMEWIASLLLEARVRLALGHFQKDNPSASAQCVRSLLQVARERCHCYPSGMIITDHLFNDMPLKFRHAWRTQKDRIHRVEDLRKMHLDHWSIDNLGEVLGEVPAVLMRAALEGMLILCLNFDNEHVDLDICRRVIELTGTESVIAMTDRIDGASLGGQKLERREESKLWYREHGVVAAGSCTIDQQICNLRAIGLSEEAIWRLVSFTPLQVLDISPQYDNGLPKRSCYISNRGARYYIDDDC